MGMVEELEKYFKNTSKKKVKKAWKKSEKFDKVKPTVKEYMEFLDVHIAQRTKKIF